MRRKKNRSQGKKQPQQTGVNPDGGRLGGVGGVHSMLLVSRRLASFSCWFDSGVCRLGAESAEGSGSVRFCLSWDGVLCPSFLRFLSSVVSGAALRPPDVPFFFILRCDCSSRLWNNSGKTRRILMGGEGSARVRGCLRPAGRLVAFTAFYRALGTHPEPTPPAAGGSPVNIPTMTRCAAAFTVGP